MKTRFEIASDFKKHWPLLWWVGDEHTKGIYFDTEYGYMIDRSYAIRAKHNEPVGPVFYVPDPENDEDEVYTEYPYKNMNKEIRKFIPLFRETALTHSQLNDLFEFNPELQFNIHAENILNMLRKIPNKRLRNKCWIKICLYEKKAEISVINRQKEEVLSKEIFEIVSIIRCNREDYITLHLNANTLLHTLTMNASDSFISILAEHDRIKVTFRDAADLMWESVISAPKHIANLHFEGPD